MTKRIKVKDFKEKINFLCRELPKELERLFAEVKDREEVLKQREVDRINKSWIFKFIKKKTKENTYFSSAFVQGMQFDPKLRQLRYMIEKITSLDDIYSLRSTMVNDLPEQEYDLPVTLVKGIETYYEKLCKT